MLKEIQAKNFKGIKTVINDGKSMNSFSLQTHILEGNCEIEGVIFANLVFILDVFKRVAFKNCRFMGCRFRTNRFVECDFYDCVFYDCHFNDLYLYKSNFFNTKVISSNIYGLLEYNDQGKNFAESTFVQLCPKNRGFVGWKKAVVGEYGLPPRLITKSAHQCLVKLWIPEDAITVNSCERKCRCNKAKVLEITNLDNGKHIRMAYSIYASDLSIPIRWSAAEYEPFPYMVGEEVFPDYFDDDVNRVCANGIHFFLNKQDAINYKI